MSAIATPILWEYIEIDGVYTSSTTKISNGLEKPTEPIYLLLPISLIPRPPGKSLGRTRNWFEHYYNVVMNRFISRISVGGNSKIKVIVWRSMECIYEDPECI